MTIQITSTTDTPEQVTAAMSTSPDKSKDEAKSAPEASTPEQKTASESEPEETEAEVESEDSESHEGETEAKDENGEKPKKKGGFQRRIDKLSAQKAAAQNEAEYWKQQALKGAGESKTEAKADPKATATEGKPNPDKFETHAEYVEALADWTAERKLAERDQKVERAKLEAEQAKQVQAYSERMKSYAEKVSDYHEVLEAVDDIPLSPTIRSIILSSENGPELAYEMAKNREEFARICNLSPTDAALEIGEIRARIKSKATGEPKTESKKITQAPKPLQPVGTGGKGSVPKSIYDPDLSQKEYERLRAKQRSAG